MSRTSTSPTKPPQRASRCSNTKKTTLEPDDHALLNPLRWAEVVRLGQEGWELVSVQPLMRGVTEIGNQNAQRLGLGVALPVSYPLFSSAQPHKNTPDPRRVFLAEWNQGDRQADRTLICKRFAVNTPHPSLRRSCLAALAWCAGRTGAFAASASEQANLEVMIRQLNALEDTARQCPGRR